MVDREVIRKTLLVLLGSAVLVLSACPPPGSDTGSLALSISANIAARTIQPSVEMIIAHYTIQGSGPGGTSFRQDGVTDSNFHEESLSVGSWTITVDALNSGEVTIATDQKIVTIYAGQTTSASVSPYVAARSSMRALSP